MKTVIPVTTDPHALLTEREIIIVRGIANSVPRKAIGACVGLGVTRLDEVVGEICVKVGIDPHLTRAATLTRWAVQHKIADL